MFRIIRKSTSLIKEIYQLQVQLRKSLKGVTILIILGTLIK